MNQIHSASLRSTRASRLRRLPALLLTLLAVTALGCQPKEPAEPVVVSPTATYTGPEHLRNTVGSLAKFRNYSPLLVSGYGIVVWPAGEGAGSSEVPAELRERLVNMMRKRGIGSARLRSRMPKRYEAFMRMSPDQFLASKDTAVVAVQGLVPPGAVKGAPFDVLVSAVDSQTTSLAGARLWTTDLSIMGAQAVTMDMQTQARAYGPIYINPYDEESSTQDKKDFLTQGIVVAGGRATRDQSIQLILNQPSWRYSRQVSDRINERFPASPDEREPTAAAKTARKIEINIPRDYAANPRGLLELISHLYIDRAPGFEAQKTRDLLALLEERPEMASDRDEARRILLAWRALGKQATPVLREAYQHEHLDIRLMALEAGAWLEDERASRSLYRLADHEKPEVRRRVAEALVHLPSSFRGEEALRALLDDDSRTVRIAAYESLASIGSPMIDRVVVPDVEGVKLIIDRVPADKPLVYIAQEGVPRLVIFGEELSLSPDRLARLWDNRLMVKSQRADQPIELFYQKPDATEPDIVQIQPSVAWLAYKLAHQPSRHDPDEGLGLSYSEVIDVIHHLCRKDHIPAPVEVRLSPLAKRIAEYEQQRDTPGGRPETSTDAADEELRVGMVPQR
ncbi:MAG: flagellar basal body P-ring protein FlgI [Phycisphaeraceae bacterium]